MRHLGFSSPPGRWSKWRRSFLICVNKPMELVLVWINASKGAQALAALRHRISTCFMPVFNSDIVRSLNKLADLLELEGANPFRIRAYRKAAWVVGELPRSVTAMTAAGEDLAELPGIGKALAEKIETLAATGHIAALDEIERRTPSGPFRLAHREQPKLKEAVAGTPSLENSGFRGALSISWSE
jgi:hypothetical protein